MMLMKSTGEVGAWDADLFARFKRAKGAQRLALKNEILRRNLPLLKVITGQVAGITDERTGPPRAFKGRTRSGKRNVSKMRVPGADQAEWDDLLQMALAGAAQGLERYDPEKGGFAGYSRWWILTKIQRFMRREHIITAPEGKHEQRPAVALVSDDEVLERLAGHDLEDGDDVVPEGVISIEQLHRWEAAGAWPPGFEEARQNYLAMFPPAPAPVPPMTVDLFVSGLRFALGARVAESPFFSIYERQAMSTGAHVDRRGLRDRLEARGVRRRGVRVSWASDPVPGLHGVAFTSRGLAA